MPLHTQFVLAMIAVVFRTAVCCAEGIETNREIHWCSIENKNFTLYYCKDFENDAKKTEAYLDKTIEALTSEFSEYEPSSILKKIDCYVYLHPEANENASDGRSVCITRGLGDGRRHAELHFLTPTRKNPQSTDSIGEIKDENHFFRYIVHEYSSIWLGVIVRGKGKGWFVNGNDCPNWFWQGYEEYLGLTLSSAHSRNFTFARYMTFVKKDPDQVLLAYGYRDKTPRIVVQHDYTDGFALLAFMHDRFGKKSVQSILASEKETFWEAMGDAFQIDVAEVYEKYQHWVENWESP